MSDILLRIKKIITKMALSDSAFAKSIDIPQTTFSNLLNRDSDPKADVLKSIIKKYNISADWLLTGEGEMFQTEVNPPLQQNEGDLPKEAGIPFYDIDVMAHISEALDLADEKSAGVMVVPGFRDCFACFPVYGDSMEPKISNGDIIAVSQPVPIERILWGEIYLVVTDCWRVVKTVHPGATEEYIILRSINPDYKGDTPVRKDDVYGLYLVRGVVSRMGM